jgi:hypothetical protein
LGECAAPIFFSCSARSQEPCGLGFIAFLQLIEG